MGARVDVSQDSGADASDLGGAFVAAGWASTRGRNLLAAWEIREIELARRVQG